MDFMVFNPPERMRTYYFPNNEIVNVPNVNKLHQTESGKHVLETTDDRKLIVNKGWLWVEIFCDEWT